MNLKKILLLIFCFLLSHTSYTKPEIQIKKDQTQIKLYQKQKQKQLKRKQKQPHQNRSFDDENIKVIKTEKSYFLNKRGNLHPHIITMQDLAELAKRYYQGKMHTAFDRGESILKAHNIPMSALLWFRIELDSDTFFKEWDQIHNKDGTIKDKYKYPKGLAIYSEDFHNEDMNEGYRRGIIFLKHTDTTNDFEINKNVMEQTGWIQTAPMQTSSLFWKNYNILVDQNGKPKKEWEGINAQIRYAKEHTKGKMLISWQTQLYIFGSNIFGWEPISKDIKPIEETIKKFFNPNGQLKAEYKKQKGYLLYAEENTKGNLNEAFEHFRYLPLSIQKNLSWFQFNGSIEEFKRDISTFKQYKNMKGLIEFASKFYKGSIMNAYYNVLAIFEGNEAKLYKETGWLPFYGDITTFASNNIDTVSYYLRDKKALITKNGDINPRYIVTEGHIRFADKYYNGEMDTAYYNARATFESHNLSPIIGWILFPGTTSEFKRIQDFISTHYPTEILSELTTEEKKEIKKLFIRENNILPAYKKDFEKKITSVLSSYRVKHLYLSRCERGF